MAAPPSPSKNRPPGDLRVPLASPAPVHSRDAHPIHGRPVTPNNQTPAHGWISPVQTPQGSPSKKQFPPGARDLPNAFDTTLQLKPPAGNGFPQPGDGGSRSGGSPTRGRAPLAEDKAEFRQSVIHDTKRPQTAGSPTRNKENTPPLSRLGFDVQKPSSAAHSRKDAYRAKDTADTSTRAFARLSPEQLEKLQKPSVKRLANVTQLYFLDYYFELLSYVHNRQNRLQAFHESNPSPPETDEADYGAAYHKYLGKERAYLRKRRLRLRYGDFQILTQVGQGGYGQVYLAQKKDTREVCALKVMSKKLLFKMDEVRHVLTERDILTNATSEWLVRLLYAFQDERSIYLAMEYVPGGDFRTLLNNTGVLHNRHARFYIAEMFACVDALHQLGYIHRDLKPENFLIDGTGHVKLTDFGLAAGMLVPAKIESMRQRLEQVGNTPVPFGVGITPMDQRTASERRESYRTLREQDPNYAKSIVGSPDYMAPEVLGGKTYDYTVDYWSLGCMLYEALAGYPPFAGATVDETWRNLKEWERVFQKPVYEDPDYFLSKRTWSLITRCICRREHRFNNFGEIKEHAYFSDVRFDTIRDPEQGERAPFVPELESETDAGYFDDFGNEKDMAKYKEVHDKQRQLEDLADRGEKMSKGLWVGFTFRHRKPGPNASEKSLEVLEEEEGADEGDYGPMI